MSNHNLKNMSLAKNIFAAFLAATVSFANADNYEGYESSIEGVGLWWLETSSVVGVVKNASSQWLTQAADRDGHLVIRSLRFGDNSEFAIFCNGNNKVFIYEKAGNGYVCKTVAWGEQVDGEFIMHDLSSSSMEKMRHVIELAKKDKHSDAGQSRYFVSLRDLKVESQRIFSVSKNKLVRGNWIESVLTQDELNQSKKIASLHIKDVHREKDNNYKTVIGFNNEEIKNIASREKAETYTLKIKAGDIEIILLPTLYESAQEGNLITTVVLHEHDTYRFLGHIYGCLLSVGADIDSDGFPEVILENCYSSESQRIDYIKIYPEIKDLISYSHS